MDPNADKDRLFDDVFAEATPADFRGAMLGETLRLAGRRRRRRQAGRAIVMTALAGLLAVLVWRNLPQRRLDSTTVTIIKPTSYELVRTRALPAESVITTQPLAAEQVVRSRSEAPEILTAEARQDIRVINDEELMAIVGRRPAALVRLGPDSELLIFANPEDEAGFPVN